MAACSSDSSALFYLKLYIGYAGTDKTFSFFNQTIYICSHWGSFLPQGWEVFGLPYSQRLPNHSLAARSSRRAQASLALGPCSSISLSSPMVPLLQLPGLSHGPSKAEHLGRQFLLFRKIACNQGPMRAGFCSSVPFELAAPHWAHSRGSAPWCCLHVLVCSKYIRRSLCLVRSLQSMALRWKKQPDINYPRASSLLSPFYCLLFWVDNCNRTEKKRGVFLALVCHSTIMEY